MCYKTFIKTTEGQCKEGFKITEIKESVLECPVLESGRERVALYHHYTFLMLTLQLVRIRQTTCNDASGHYFHHKKGIMNALTKLA